MEPRINIITLGVSDLERSRRFYESGLGWKTVPTGGEEIYFFQLGGLVFALYSWKGLAEDAMADPAGHGFRGVTLAYNVRDKEEVREVLALAERAGGTIVKSARDVFWGGHSGYFADPDGHLWEVAWNPFFPLNERGEIVLPKQHDGV